MSVTPSLRHERALLKSLAAGGAVHLACADEVGRGALSGPVSIGMVVISLETRTAPQGVRDSKLLSPEVRERLAPKVRRWALSHAVGHASPTEIDAYGIVAAMRLAGRRALAALNVAPDAILLDGNHDYLSEPDQEALFGGPAEVAALRGGGVRVPPVTTMIKADMRCAGVAGASILAKTTRDALMIQLHEDFPAYLWAENKGYSAPGHVAALAAHGPSIHHRCSWSLPGVGVGVGERLGSVS